ncbi:hypothetical protein EC957_010255 [Mortierella hygrophila]|uniref:Uncharacterized protein n=1 Tax=Mortierella hygrophila TaxID=979708 RepID=A0A9P6EW37_9FUNG|nr:hypothetical protein EC957_010255 [Mortierella hygrophila]
MSTRYDVPPSHQTLFSTHHPTKGSKEAILSQINVRYRAIMDLERTEERYVGELLIRSNSSRSLNIFDSTLNNQAARAELYQVRTQICDLALLQGRLIVSLSQIDSPLAAQLNFALLQKMVRRFDELRREVDGYLAESGVVLERNMVHVGNNGVLMGKIATSFNLAVGH